MGETPTILIVDDERLVRWALKERFTEANYRSLEADTAASALEQLDDQVDLVLLDYRLPDADGFELLTRIKSAWPQTAVIMMTAYSNISSAVEAIKRGAFHYANKPFDLKEMLVLVEQGLEATRLQRQLRTVRVPDPNEVLPGIVGRSPAIVDLKRLLAKVARSPATTVLLTGESGTGKDLAARSIHASSARAARPFMNITCSALPEALLESELFGHEKGAFTDARQQKKGLLEQADGGTVFLDEIGELVPSLQAKILRFLEEKTFKRVGGTADIAIQVRIVAATNRDLDAAVTAGTFRADLFYRLKVMPVHLPPLRDRSGDVPLLLAHYIEGFNRDFERHVGSVSPAAMAKLEAYPWPGNVRELRNAVERAMLLSESETLTAEDFDFLLSEKAAASAFRLPEAGLDFELLEKDLVSQALERTGGNQTRAAVLLGMNRDQIRYRIEKFGLPRIEPG